MAHSTAIPAGQQAPKTQFDWSTFLLNAFINGLKAYGAALMVAAPEPGAGAPEPALRLSKDPSHFPAPQVTKPQPFPTLPNSTLVNPALNEAWTRA